MLSEAIREEIETRLNNNTQGKVYQVGAYSYNEDTQKDFIFTVKNGYTEVDVNFIPVFITPATTYQPIVGQINGNFTIGLEALILAENTATMQTDVETTDELISKIVADPFSDIVDGAKTYHTAWNMEGLVASSGLFSLNGNLYFKLSTTIYIEFSDTNNFGNQFVYYLNDRRIKPFIVKVTRDNEENNPHLLGETEAKGGNATSVWTADMTFYVSDFISSVVDTLSSAAYNMEEVYLFKEVTPTKPEGEEFYVKLKNGNYSVDMGTKATVNMIFYKSDDSYTEATYDITYELDLGTNNPSNPADFVYGDLPVTLYEPTKTNYTFDGWYDNDAFTGLALTEISIAADITIYAKWTFVPFKAWSAVTVIEYNDEIIAGNAGTFVNTVNPEVEPGVSASAYPLNFVARVSDGETLPVTYYYYQVTLVTSE